MTPDELAAAIKPFADAAGAPPDRITSLDADATRFTIRWCPADDPTTVITRTINIEDQDT